MNTKTASFAICFLITLSLVAVRGDEKPAASTAGNVVEGAIELPRLQGIMGVAGKYYASLAMPRAGGVASAWVTDNEALPSCVVEHVDSQKVTVKVRGSGKIETLWLNNAPSNPSDGQAAVAEFSRQWINSKSNPMLYRATPLPPKVAGKWMTLTLEEREKIIEYYKKHGWQLVRSESGGGSVMFEWKNLFEDERLAALKEGRQLFDQSLSPDELEKWKSFGSQVAFRAGSMPDEDMLKIASERRAAKDAFLSSLSEEKQRAYQRSVNFTLADWNKSPKP